MQIYYVKVHVNVEYSFIEYDEYYYFNSKNAMKEWMKFFKSQQYSLRHIVEHGESHFNSHGVLCP